VNPHTLFPLLAVAAVLCYGLYNASLKKTAHSRTLPQQIQRSSPVKVPAVPTDLKRYIVHVINHGSKRLRFKKEEVMEGGFVSETEAPMVACYVMSLAGDSCPSPVSPDAAMYFSSNCAGCHGSDGKGAGGAYPDLTRRPLLGMEQ
jgi:mono/diheme cytochrome c family protein